MSLERMTGMIESLGEHPQLRTEKGRTWFLKPAPGITGDRLAALGLRVAEKVEVFGSVPASLAGECRLFSVRGRKFPDGSQIDLMDD
jgi:hypothetical protein